MSNHVNVRDKQRKDLILGVGGDEQTIETKFQAKIRERGRGATRRSYANQKTKKEVTGDLCVQLGRGGKERKCSSGSEPPPQDSAESGGSIADYRTRLGLDETVVQN